MTAYIIRRLLFMVPTMFGIMLVAFVVVQFALGDHLLDRAARRELHHDERYQHDA